MRRLSNNRISLSLLASLAGFLFSFQISWASQITPENVIDLVNYSRTKEGLAILAENSQLNQAALEKAQDMIQHDYFAHISPRGVTPWFWFEKNQYDYRYAGENLAINFQNAEEEHEAWMESPDHRKNILSPKYQEIGVAVERGMIDGRMTMVAVQLFGAREGAAAVQSQDDSRGSLAFVESPDQNAVAGAEKMVSPFPESSRPNSDPGRWAEFLEGLSVVLLLAAVGANPIVFGWFLIQNRKPTIQDVVYPVRLTVIK